MFRRSRERHPPTEPGNGAVIEARLSRAQREAALLEGIVERMSEGAIVFDEVMGPVFTNQAAREMLDLGMGPLQPRLPSEDIVSIARRAFFEGSTFEKTISLRSRGEMLNLRTRALPLPDHEGVLVFLRDVTEELHGQRVRRQFVAHASHELKSPVASVQTLAEAIKEATADDPDTVAKFSDRMILETERLGKLVTDLLDLSRLEDPANISSRHVDLSVVAEGEVAKVAATAAAKNLDLKTRIGEAVMVRGDEHQLGLMIRNLLDNALRYTPDGGRVRVEVEVEDDEAVVRVADDGIGIPLRAQSRVFERFFRVDEARSRDKGGTGLGLAIVKHVVEMHSGHVELTSELGEGSTFTVTLPLLQTPASPASESA